MADSELIDMAADTAPTTDDLIYVVNDPGGTPADKKVTLGNAMLLAPHFVPRGDLAGVDYAVFTADGAYHDLDLSAIVPAGAIAVYLRIIISDNATGSLFKVRKNGNTNEEDAIKFRTQVINLNNDLYGIVECDSNRIIEYQATNTTWSSINIAIIGWFIDTIN